MRVRQPPEAPATVGVGTVLLTLSEAPPYPKVRIAGVGTQFDVSWPTAVELLQALQVMILPVES